MNQLPLDSFYSELMGNLIFARKHAGITQLTIAAAIGCSRQEVANKETLRSRITPEQIESWCRACRISVADVWPNHEATDAA
ncbi:MAG: helix-turn-helix transcriptional regulator [Acidobacteria bacterium]|nr:helix-turn-helix transcriptional regulator [Acidobacteriota bacterium]